MLAIPRRDHSRAVGVHVRDEQKNHVVADEPHFIRFFGDDLVHQQRRRLPVCHLRGVEAEVDPDDGLSLARERARFVIGQAVAIVLPVGRLRPHPACRRPRQREPARDVLVLAELAEVLFRGDDGEYLRPSFGRLPHLDELHPRRDRDRQFAEIIFNLFVGGQLVIGARRPADDRLGCRRCRLRERGDTGQSDRCRHEKTARDADHPPILGDASSWHCGC